MLGVGENTRVLQRYEIIERACMRFSAGWAMATTAWDVKVMLGRHMWQDAERAERIRKRLKELRSGRLAADNASGLAAVVDYTARATDTAEYLAGMYHVLKRALLDACIHHRAVTDIVLDDATHALLTENITTLEEQLRWADEAASFPLHPAYDEAATAPWRAAVTAMLQGAGGIDGSEERPDDLAYIVPVRDPFARPHTQMLDGFVLQTARDTPPATEMGEPWRQWVFRNFLNEIGAGDNVASVLFDAPTEMDSGFFYDIARHGWDEYRHAMMGYRRLTEFGYDPHQFALGTGVAEFRDRLPVVDRLGMLVLIDESSAFNYKHGSRKFFQRTGDDVSADYLMYDICDETRHVFNGRRWLEPLQHAVGDTRDHDRLMADLERGIAERVAFLGTGNRN